jgi:hypothetical protein
MTHQRSLSTTVAILGSDTLAEGILVRLLEDEGYATKLLEAQSRGRGVVDEVLEGVDVLLLTPSLSPDVRGTILGAMRSTPKTAHIPVLSLSPSLKLALLDELAVSASWRSLLRELVRKIEAFPKGAVDMEEATHRD